MMLRNLPTAVLAATFVLTAAATATAAPFVVGVSDFIAAPGATLTTFEGVAEGEANGRTVDGLALSYAGGNDVIAIGSIGLTSNNVTDPVLSGFTGTPLELTVSFASPVVGFGFGFAFLSELADPSALSLTTFAGATALGTIEFGSVADPGFVGGFAGLTDSTAFDRVVITFTQEQADAFAIDNLRTIPAPIPEPASLTLLGVALVGLLRRRQRH